MFLNLAALALVVFANSQPVSQEIDCNGGEALLQIHASRHGRKSAGAPTTVELKRGSTSTGIMMPLVGLGAAQGPTLKKSIAAFLGHGGQLIDTAIMYGHRPVGEALRAAMETAGIARESFWVTSKILPQAANTSQETLALVEQSLLDLGITYIDLFLIHWPGDSMVEIWKGLIQARNAGKLRAIGVSNFSPEQISELEGASGERPSVNQLQYHPWVADDVYENVRWCLDHGVAVTAYGSLGGQYHDGLHDTTVQAVASKHSVSSGQVLLRWALHQGVAVIPGATTEKHILEDLDVGSFELDADEASPLYFRKS